MKRLRKALHVALVWTTVSLLFVDPAAACRLMCRRCCRCCCSASASCQAGVPELQTEASPYEVPPLASDGGQFFNAPLANPSPSVSQVTPVEREPAPTTTFGEATVTPAAPTSPSALGSA